jgi:hypothetical protein
MQTINFTRLASISGASSQPVHFLGSLDAGERNHLTFLGNQYDLSPANSSQQRAWGVAYAAYMAEAFQD